MISNGIYRMKVNEILVKLSEIEIKILEFNFINSMVINFDLIS